MNKIFGYLCAGTFVVFAASCGGNKQAENDSIIDSTAVEVVEEIDTVNGDTAIAVEATEAVEEAPADAAKKAVSSAKKSADKAVKETQQAVKEETKAVEKKAQTASEKAEAAARNLATKTEKVAEEGLDDRRDWRLSE